MDAIKKVELVYLAAVEEVKYLHEDKQVEHYCVVLAVELISLVERIVMGHIPIEFEQSCELTRGGNCTIQFVLSFISG